MHFHECFCQRDARYRGCRLDTDAEWQRRVGARFSLHTVSHHASLLRAFLMPLSDIHFSDILPLPMSMAGMQKIAPRHALSKMPCHLVHIRRITGFHAAFFALSVEAHTPVKSPDYAASTSPVFSDARNSTFATRRHQLAFWHFLICYRADGAHRFSRCHASICHRLLAPGTRQPLSAKRFIEASRSPCPDRLDHHAVGSSAPRLAHFCDNAS